MLPCSGYKLPLYPEDGSTAMKTSYLTQSMFHRPNGTAERVALLRIRVVLS
jgi:hypothetical protein